MYIKDYIIAEMGSENAHYVKLSDMSPSELANEPFFKTLKSTHVYN